MVRLGCIIILLITFSCKAVITDPEIGNISEPKSSGEIIAHRAFTLSYSEQHEQASWVYYSITPVQCAGSPKWPEKFREDTNVTTGSASNDDYQGSGYEKGHLCLAGSMQHDSVAYVETYYLSNISPQLPDFNGGVWVRLENKVRKWAEEYHKVWVVTGPIFQNNLDTIGPNKVTVPGSFYKVVFNGTDQMIGFIVPHRESDSTLDTFAVQVDKIEQQTGIDFFPELPDDIEKELEANFSLSYWF
jgi:endonuclease G, mitochondrial